MKTKTRKRSSLGATIRMIVALVLLLAVVAGGGYWYYTHKVTELQQQITSEQEQKQKLDERIQEVVSELNTTTDALDKTKDENNSLSAQVKDLFAQIDDLLAKDVVVFDAGMVTEEIQNIGELATVEYRYTNVGTIDASKEFFNTGWTLPLTQKTAVVSMDGVLKAGIDVSDVKITSNDSNRTIIVKMPDAKILSNELDEDSLQVYDESSGLFNSITLKDSSELRKDIKNKAEENALNNGILEQAEDRAEDMIRCIIEAIPNVKDLYTISFR